MSFYVYKTGTLSYNCRSFVGTKGEYHEYYAYNAEDDHEKVLMKFRDDLRKLRPYFDDFFYRAAFEEDAIRTNFPLRSSRLVKMRRAYKWNSDH